MGAGSARGPGRPGGGFLAGAMQTALGVAGGVLIADALTSASTAAGRGERACAGRGLGRAGAPMPSRPSRRMPAMTTWTSGFGMGGDGFEV